MHLTILDLIAVAMDRPSRPLDWTIALHLSDSLTSESLEAGAGSARQAFPTSACARRGRAWVNTSAAAIASRQIERAELQNCLDRLANTRMNIVSGPAIVQQQFTMKGERGSVLVTRVHHALSDLVGVSLWLNHQLQVATGARDPLSTGSEFQPPLLRGHSTVARKSVYAFRGASDVLAHSPSAPSPTRRWQTFTVANTMLRESVAKEGSFTYNDALAACALDTYRTWNERHAPRALPRVGLWMPVNIRENALAGFGNGSTRIRVYDHLPRTATLHERARMIRTQVNWSRAHGEWALPNLQMVERLPLAVSTPLLRAYFNRPWVDMATGPFSHAGLSALDELPTGLVTRVELVGTLDTRHPFGIFALTLRDHTHVSFLHDPWQLGEGDARELVSLFKERLRRVK